MTTPDAGRPGAARARPAGRRGFRPTGLNPIGSVAGTVLLCLSFTPSLLPRSWLLQGVLSGLTAVTGYAVGCCVAALAARVSRWRPSARGLRWATRTWYLVAVPAAGLSAYHGWIWQGRLSRIMGMEPPPAVSWPAAPAVAGAVFLAALFAGRLLRRGADRLGGFLRQRRRLVTLPALLAILAYGAVAAPVSASSGRDSAAVSLSRQSLDPHGRSFLAGAPSPEELRRFSGLPPRRPLRVYAGLHSVPDVRTRARIAVDELERTGAFDRKVLCVVIPTGTGWVDEPTLRALELQYNGDTALVAIQYSALPSWLSFVTAPDQAGEAATALLDELYRRRPKGPGDSRPRMLLYGHSLGAFGAQAAFDRLDSVLDRVDGALISGPPNGSARWRSLVAHRDAATTEVAPSLGPGSPIRFAGGTDDLIHTASTGTVPRMVFLQHPTDPVVWWSPRLVLHRPDWLREPRGRGVLPDVRWYPIVTFWQLFADLLVALDVPAGFGHSYSAEAPSAWALLADPAQPDRS